MNGNNPNRNPFGRGTYNGRGSSRRSRRGIAKAQDKKWHDALKKLKEIDKLQQQVNILEAERKNKLVEANKIREEEEMRIANEAKIKNEELANAKIIKMVNDAVQQRETLASLEAAEQKRVEVPAQKSPKKSWFSWLLDW